MTETSVARRETKYLLDLGSAYCLQQRLEKVLPVDRPGEPDGYLVRSLYFDSIHDQDYYDKVDGLETRRKIRLRIYSTADTTAKLEVKEKQGSDQWKRSASLPKEDAQLLIQRDYDRLLQKYHSPFLQAVLHKMQMEGYVPKTIVEFRRLAYMGQANNTRITFDTRLAATEANFDLFSPQLPLYPILYPVILEVKYNHFLLSYMKDLLHLADQIPVSTSKYCLGRQISFY
ncbi:MAG: polyphosphate polymerase domain-containing protein [Oscillospiraceae bacterium]